jgi:hypothetical protein
MKRMIGRTHAGAALAVLLLLATDGRLAAQEFAGREKLRAHSDEFRKDVIKVTDAVYVAVGFSDANSILIQGDGGSIIVDTTSDVTDAGAVKASSRNSPPRPYARSSTPTPTRITPAARPSSPEMTTLRSTVINFSSTASPTLAEPAAMAATSSVHPFRTRCSSMLALACSSDDTLLRRATSLQPAHSVATGWRSRLRVFACTSSILLERRPKTSPSGCPINALLPGDDFYKAFPNLYAIRGARLRPVDQWVASLGMMISLGAEYLVPGHTRPIIGSANVRVTLTIYRDGIKSILDQTIEGMKKGERPDELVRQVKLPAALADSPYLQEFYGTVARAVRAIYTDYAGWFDGNPANLFPLPEKDRAARIVELAGDPEQVLLKTRRALANKDFQWAAELSDYVLAIDGANVEAKRLNAAALSELGERQISAIARNYCLSAAQYLLRGLPAQ